MRHEPAVFSDLCVVELAVGISQLGAGMAASVPGMFFADHGATVVRIEGPAPAGIDHGVEYERVWNRGKRLCRIDMESAGGRAEARALMERADVVFVMAADDDLARWGVQYGQAALRPDLVYCHVAVPDATGRWELLLQAASGLMALPRRGREGPVFLDLPTAAFGTALATIVGALAALVQREETGRGQLVETSLLDGMLALLGLLCQRVGQPTPATEAAGKNLLSSTWLYECADGAWIHLHPGAKGAFGRIQALLSDDATDPTGRGGPFSLPAGVAARAYEGWRAAVGRRDREALLADMWAADIPAEPALPVGAALRDAHVRTVGLAVEQPDPDDGTIIAVGPVVRLRGFSAGPWAGRPAVEEEPAALLELLEAAQSETVRLPEAAQSETVRLLEGLRVLDFGNWVAGPLGDQVLADLGADVIKVEGVDGDPGRASDVVFFAGQRGKRSLALDLKSPDAGPVLEKLFAWCDVVHHNFRPGVAERLGIDESSVRACNPLVVYCHSPAYGSRGPKAAMAGFDQMIQAFSGVESAAGGEGGDPMWYPWAPMDTGGGWLSAAAMLMGVYCRARTRQGQYCESTQLGAGLLAKSGVFLVGDETRTGPVLDREQTGFGPGFRIYRAGDERWIALVVRDEHEWARLRELPGMTELPERYVPLRLVDAATARRAEAAIAASIATRPSQFWTALLSERGILSAVVADHRLPEFVSSSFEQQEALGSGSAARFSHSEYEWVEVPGVPYRFSSGDVGSPIPPPSLGQQSAEILSEMGLNRDEIAQALSGASGSEPALAGE